jgi:hypothetical protein
MLPSAHGTWHRLLLMLLMLLTALASHVRAQGAESTMASLIFRCAKYVDWPKEKMRPGAPFVIGVMGSEFMSDKITEMSYGRKMKDREVVVKHFAAAQEIAGCHVLFIGRSEMPRQRSLLSSAQRADVLTFGDNENFEKDGGMIHFSQVNGVTKFLVNFKKIKGTDLKMDPELAASGR